MGKLKEKLKPEKLSATFLAYILAYFMCMMTGFCMIMFFRELMYQIGILKRYGLGEIGNVASALLFVLVCAFFFYHGAKIIICRAHKKAQKELKHPNGLYGMPIECCAAIYFACTDEFDPVTMESRLVPGLYACGEVLDIDGDCGGYNLQWAWASGRAAGRACR